MSTPDLRQIRIGELGPDGHMSPTYFGCCRSRALKPHQGKVTVFMPHYAMSGGALIALAADAIVVSPNAKLQGAIDPQVEGA
jgi:hypothetical protein